MRVLYIFIAILVFGFLILIHEFGHYLTARLFGVKVFEFAIGMGPKLLWYESKKTGIVYSLRMFPIGGFVSLLGEDPGADREAHPELFGEEAELDEGGVPRDSLAAKPAWQKLIVNAAGAAMNLLLGAILMTVITCSLAFPKTGHNQLGTTVIAEFTDPEDPASSYAQGLREWDEVIRVNGRRVRIADQLLYRVMRDGNEPLTLTVLRDGAEVELTVTFATVTAEGQVLGDTDFLVYAEGKVGFGTVAKHAFYKTVYVMEMVWESFFDLLRGRYTVDAVSGPVGTASAIGDAAEGGLQSLAYIAAVITLNLGVFNLFPLPALDGGHIFVNLAEIVSRRKIPPRITAVVDTVGLILLMILMALVTFKDIFKLFGR